MCVCVCVCCVGPLRDAEQAGCHVEWAHAPESASGHSHQAYLSFFLARLVSLSLSLPVFL